MTIETSVETETTSGLEILQQRIKEAREAIDQWSRICKSAARPLRVLSRKDAPDDSASVTGALQLLDKLQLPDGPLRMKVDALKTALRVHLADEDQRLRLHFGRDLREAAARAGIPFASLTTAPPEFRLGRFTLLVDVARRIATLRYARNDLTKVSLKSEAILEALHSQQSQLEGKAFDSARYFEQLLQAYQMRLHRIQQPFGARVDIIDLLAELAFMRQGNAFFEDPRRENFIPYSRVQLAYDLARLRACGRLAHRGFRLGLGSATGGSTKQKNRVLYVEDEQGSGQWYLSLRFSREGETAENAATGARNP